MFETKEEKASYELEKKSDVLMVDVLRLLARAVDKRCMVHGRLRYIDKELLNKSIQLVMTYDKVPTLNKFAKELNVSATTLHRMIHSDSNQTVNRLTVDKVIDYMYKVADKIEEKNRKQK